MRAVIGHVRPALNVLPWQLEVAQVLDEHHVCAWSDDPRRRARFASDLAGLLGQLEGTQVCELDGARVRDLPGFCAELSRAAGVGPVEARIDSAAGVVGALRRRPVLDGPAPLKRRYVIWTEAHVLLREDPALFGRLADAIAGVAAEEEFYGEDLLLLQRAVFVGRASLDVYAEDPRGQFRSWFSERGEPPLWKVITGLAAPSVRSWRIGPEVTPAAVA
jgi:hypothetical protein